MDQNDGTLLMAALWLSGVLVLLAVIGLGLWSGRWGFLSGRVGGARTVIRIVGGKVRLSRGAISPMAREQLQSLVDQFGIQAGTVGITASRRVIIAGIPKPAHQPIRNVLFNL